MNKKKTQPVTELWQTTQKWLLLLGNKPNTKFCREEISTHPDYPAITSVIDFLELGKMQYKAVQADASNIHEFTYPLLAHIRQPGQEYLCIIANAEEWDKQKEITQHWSGVTIFPEKKGAWQSEQNSIYQKTEMKNKTFALTLMITGFLLLILSTIKQSNSIAIFFGSLSLIGFITSIVLSATELGYQSQVVKQVCGIVSNGGCEGVLKSEYAKGVFGITPADASLLYFSTQFIFYLLSPYFTNFLLSISLFALAGILIAVWSIYTQGIKLKQWCALCLAIASVLTFQTISAFFLLNIGSKVDQFLIANFFLPFIIFTVLVCFLYFILCPIKQLFRINNINRQKITELKKWKTDSSLFINQWEKEQQIDTTIWQDDLIIGNSDAPMLITVACNPYCIPCAKAHKELDDLINRYKNKIKVQVRLLCNTNDKADRRTIAVRAILQKAKTLSSNVKLQQMLADWFELMDFEMWKSKWCPDNNINVTKRLEEHDKWMEESTIEFTPTFFINGKKIPGRYNIKDIEILAPQLVEILAEDISK